MSNTDRSVDLDAMSLDDAIVYLHNLHPDWSGEEVGVYLGRHRKVSVDELVQLFKDTGMTVEDLLGKPN